MNQEKTDITAPDSREHAPHGVNGRGAPAAAGAAAEQARIGGGALRGGWDVTDGTLTCRWTWVEPVQHRGASVLDVAA